MIINDLDGYYIVFDTKNWNTELDTLIACSSLLILTLTETGVLSASVFFGEAESSSTFCSNLSTVP